VVSRLTTRFSIALLLTASPLVAQERLDHQLALKPGNYWIYAGTVTWAEPGAEVRTHTKEIRWKIEIAEKTQHGELEAYLVNGGFDDLPWFEPGREPGQYLWLVYKKRFFISKLDGKLLPRCRDSSDSLWDLVESDEPVLQFPLQLNSCTEPLDPDLSEHRDDGFYCWHVEERNTSILDIPGLPRRPSVVWKAWYRSNPNHQIIAFAPEVGFISYDFSHLGTPSEAHVRLVEAHLR
jgi:hypothetical protein